MRRSILACACCLLLVSACDLFKLDTESRAITGRWASNVVARSGDCCHIDLNLETDEDIVTGRGVITTPGQSLGEELRFSVEMSGEFRNERLELRSASQANPVVIEGVLDRDASTADETVLRVDFEGFGKSGRDIILFQR